MLSDLKHLVLGLAIGLCATALVAMAIYFSAFAGKGQNIAPASPALSDSPAVTHTAALPSLTPSPTLTLTATPTQTPSPTITPTASKTPDAVHALINAGGMVITGALSEDQQIALYNASLKYVQSDADDSRRMAMQINGVGYGDASNVCGPLAIAILRDAGLITRAIIPHDFWLLNPLAATDRQLLRRAFPDELYAYSKTITPLNQMDWKAAPLLPGDFLFIWHGSGGNFDHMLVVSRVDSSARAYAVTNYATPEGYVIAEVMLYNPNDPTVGLLHTWTQERNAILGSTGFGGFELWRRSAP